MDDIIHLNRRRCLSVGWELIHGPRALLSPPKGDESDWLEPQLRITLRWPNYERIESIIVYVDNTMNKEDEFLPPMLRHAVWRYPNDLPGAHPWPSIVVRLGFLKNQFIVNDSLTNLEKHIPCIDYSSIGLSLKRDVPHVAAVPHLPEYALTLRNGVQSLEYSSCFLVDDSMSSMIYDSFNALTAELSEIHPHGWQERYDRNLKTEFPATCWDWNYDVGQQ